MNLLKSKSYGIDKDYFWSLKPHEIIRDLDLKPPKAEVHSFKYAHEKDCAEVFVSLALTEQLYGWEMHKKVGNGIIPDRTALLPETYYIEVERGTQDKIKQKLEAYQQYYRQTKEPFFVLFLVKDEKALTDGLKTLEGSPNHYRIDIHSRFCSNPFSNT